MTWHASHGRTFERLDAWEEVVAWFVARSVVVIVPAFVLGIVVGWLWWRRERLEEASSQAGTSRRPRADEVFAAPCASQDELRRKDDELATDQDELARLRTEAARSAGDGTSSGSATWSGDHPAATAAPETEAPVAAPTGLGSVPSDPAPETPSDPVPETLAGPATPVEEIRTEPPQAPTVPNQSAEAPGTEAPSTEAPGTEAEAEADGDGDGDETDGSSGEGDDLERVEGIGPRIGTALRGAGIHTYRELADADIATLQGALEQAGLRFAPSLPTWSRQARFLAEGNEAGFQKLAQQLTGGHVASGAK